MQWAVRVAPHLWVGRQAMLLQQAVDEHAQQLARCRASVRPRELHDLLAREQDGSAKEQR